MTHPPPDRPVTHSPDKPFSDREWLRYTRHLQLPQTGVEGQRRLKRARVLIVGAGGLGSPVALYLAAAGVGHITIVDGDRVDLTNLQRQILFTTEQVGRAKAECARQRLLALNDAIAVVAVAEYLSPDNVERLFDKVDLVLDCTDNFATRYLINDTCVRKKIPWLFASIFQFSGQCALFTPGSACFRCLFPQPRTGAADCNEAGVLGVLPGLLGTLQANEAIKYLTALECPLDNHLLLVEALDLSFRKIRLAKDPGCAACGSRPLPVDDSQYRFQCERPELAASESSTAEPATAELSVEVFKSLLAQATQPDSNPILIDVRTDGERAAFHIGGQHIPLSCLEDRVLMWERHEHQQRQGKKIVCYCQTGARSLQAANCLRERGWEAWSLKGGIVGYLQASLSP